MNSQALRGLSPFALLCSVLLLLTLPSVSYALDTDNDGFDDTIDADKDGDGIPNAIEDFYGLNSLLLADGALDLDDDGWSNADEYRFGTDLDDDTSAPSGLGTNRSEKVFAPDAAADDFFGFSVSLAGDTAVIGAYSVISGDGAVYVFVRNSGLWSLQQRLDGDGGADQYGFSVSVSGDTVVVGAPLDSNNGLNAGAVYIYGRSAGVWSEQAKLTAGESSDRFGISVAISADTAVIGQLAFGIHVFVRSGLTWSKQQKLTTTDGNIASLFGSRVAVSGGTAVIGDSGFNGNTGAAYVFVRGPGVNPWSQQQKLTAADGVANDEFGLSVSISGDTAVIGAQGDDDSTGSAYVFERSGLSWSQQDKLTADDRAIGDRFGTSVSVSGEAVVIGASGDDVSTGATYLFTRTDVAWSQQQKLTAADGVSSDSFGRSVSISGGAAVVGAPGVDDNGGRSGMAYLFDLDIDDDGLLNNADADIDGDGIPNGIESINGLDPLNSADGILDLDIDGWSNVDEYRFGTGINDIASNPASLSSTRTEKVFASDGAEGDAFGYSVSVSSDTVVIGARGEDFAGSSTGAAYVFTRSGVVWSEQQKLVALDSAADKNFGTSVSISGETAVIGTLEDTGDNGSAYVFIRSGAGVNPWSQQQKLTAADGAANDEFGRSVFVSGETALIGAYGDNNFTGSAYVYVRIAGAWSQQQKLTASDATAGDQLGISVSVSGDTLVVGAYSSDNFTGAAYVFTRSDEVWSQQDKLTAADGAELDRFGLSVSVSGDTVALGAYGDDDSGSSSGSAYFASTSDDIFSDGFEN